MESNGDGDSCETNRGTEVENGKAVSIVKEADDLQNTNEGAPEVVVTVKKITRNDEQVPKSLQTSDPHQATRAVGAHIRESALRNADTENVMRKLNRKAKHEQDEFDKESRRFTARQQKLERERRARSC